MARIAGRRGQLYVGLASDTAAASPVPFLKKYTFSSTAESFDVTAFGDTTKVYVAGFPDAQGTYDGLYDTATSQLYTAASDGLARRTYLYPDNSIPATYFMGTATFDMNLDVDAAGTVAVSGAFKAYTPFSKVG
jgi:protein involved in polysaccharide export with SLBB domain